MQKPKPTTEYEHGQMMGMLVIIMMLEQGITAEHGPIFKKIKELSVAGLAEYLSKPEEDVYLMVDKELKDIL